MQAKFIESNYMGYLIMKNLETGETEFLGDEIDRQKYLRTNGFPSKGFSQKKLDEIDKQGE